MQPSNYSNTKKLSVALLNKLRETHELDYVISSNFEKDYNCTSQKAQNALLFGMVVLANTLNLRALGLSSR